MGVGSGIAVGAVVCSMEAVVVAMVAVGSGGCEVVVIDGGIVGSVV